MYSAPSHASGLPLVPTHSSVAPMNESEGGRWPGSSSSGQRVGNHASGSRPISSAGSQRPVQGGSQMRVRSAISRSSDLPSTTRAAPGHLEDIAENGSRWRVPESGIVEVLRERLRITVEERDAFAAQHERTRKLTRATRMAEMEARIEMLSEECNRHREVNQAMKERMQDAERRAEEALAYAERCTSAMKEYMATGDVPEASELKLNAPKNAMTPARTPATLDTLKAAHNALVSQATILRNKCTAQGPVRRELTISEFTDAMSGEGAKLAGAVDVLRYLQVHLHSMAQIMIGLPGFQALINKLSIVSSGMSKAEYPYSVFLARQMSTFQELGFAMGDHLKQLRMITTKQFDRMHSLFKADVSQIEDLGELLAAEARRLRNADGGGGLSSEPSASNAVQAGPSRLGGRPGGVGERITERDEYEEDCFEGEAEEGGGSGSDVGIYDNIPEED